MQNFLIFFCLLIITIVLAYLISKLRYNKVADTLSIIGIISAIASLAFSYIINFYFGAVYTFVIAFAFLGYVKWFTESEKRIAERKRLDSIKAGNWKFPCRAFYLKCLENNASDLTDKLHFQKIKLIALNIMKSYGVVGELAEPYNSDAKIIEYFYNGKDLEEERLAKLEGEKSQNELKYMTPQVASTGNCIDLINLCSELKSVKGTEKRRIHLNYLIRKTNKSINSAKQRADAALKGAYAVHNSAHIEKEHDVALLGGAASAIGGIGAGVEVAAKAIADNERIRNQNAQNQKSVDKIAKQIAFAAFEAGNTTTLEESLKEYKQKLEELEYKVVVEDVSSEELFNNLDIDIKIKFVSDKLSYLYVKYKSNYDNVVSKDYTMVIDGTIQVKVFCDGIFVEDVCAPLPLEGLANGETKSETVYLSKYMIEGEKRTFSFEVSPNNLWLVER